MKEQQKSRVPIYERQVEKELQALLHQLENHDSIIAYQKIAKKIEAHEGLQELVEEIKQHQKEAVSFAHYDKPEAEKVALRLADEKQQAFDEHPLVIAYRERLVAANELLQYVTQLLERQVNLGLEARLEIGKEEQHASKN